MKNSKDLKELMNNCFTNEEIDKMEMEAQISGNIIKLRLEAGLTQEQLAKKAGVNQSAIARIENDDSIPRMDTFIKICKALDHKIEIVDNDYNKDSLIDVKQVNDTLNDTKMIIEKLERNQGNLEVDIKDLCNKFDKMIANQMI
jgi:transcriptional regulator with XRE-family HTH domain